MTNSLTSPLTKPLAKPQIRQRGFSLVMALFILVVLSLLGTAMLNLLAVGSESVAREVISARALFAAQSGAERKLTELMPPGASSDIAACTSPSPPYSFTGLLGCSTVAVDCSLVTVEAINYFTIRSVGHCGPVGSEAIRIIELQAKDG